MTTRDEHEWHESIQREQADNERIKQALKPPQQPAPYPKGSSVWWDVLVLAIIALSLAMGVVEICCHR